MQPIYSKTFMQSKADILARLQNEILSLQGFKPASASAQTDFGLGHIAHSFPNATFPFSALHEFSCGSWEELASSSAFIAGLLSSSLKKGGIALWIGKQRLIFPPALKTFGVNPDQFVFIHLKKEKEVLWTVEEALKCNSIVNVIGELPELQFTESRRLQLAIEQSGVGCFLLRHRPRNLTTASTARWRLKHLPSIAENGLPGMGYCRWKVDLLKVRNGKPGSWIVEWTDNGFRHPSKLAVIPGQLQKKTG